MNLSAILFAAVFSLPLQQVENWQLLQYSRLPPNQISFGAAGMSIEVNASASPVIYPLPQPRMVGSVEVSGTLDQLLRLDAANQGSAGADDFALKIGLVVAGDKTLGGVQKWFSADWIKTLFELAPEGSGIDSIYFLNAVQDRALLGRQRQHPLSDLIWEHNLWLLDKAGAFRFSHRLEQPRKVVAIWLSIDGDDSQSSYTTVINALRLGP